MTSNDSSPSDDDLHVLAAECYLGLLDAEGVRSVAVRRLRDGDFDAAVREWERRLMPLADALAPVAPPDRVWYDIEKVIVAGAPRAPKMRIWDNLNFWRYFGVSTCGVGLAVAVLAGFYIDRPAPLPFAAATLASAANGSFVATAQHGASGTLLILSPSLVRLPAGKSAELWLIVRGRKPEALGVLASGHAVAIDLTPNQLGAPMDAVALAVSIEPMGGSPTGEVTGPIIASAKFSLR